MTPSNRSYGPGDAEREMREKYYEKPAYRHPAEPPPEVPAPPAKPPDAGAQIAELGARLQRQQSERREHADALFDRAMRERAQRKPKGGER
jgi:hypothetical protein